MEAQATDLEEVLAHRRQRRRVVRSFRHVVEADDRDVAGDRPTRLVQRSQQAERHLVVGDEDGGHVAGRRRAACRARSPTQGSSRRRGTPAARPRPRAASAPSRRCAAAPRTSPRALRCARRSRCPSSSRWRVASAAPVAWIDRDERHAGLRARLRPRRSGRPRGAAAPRARRRSAARSRGSPRRPGRAAARPRRGPRPGRASAGSTVLMK